MRWDGLTSTMEEAGVAPATTAPTITSSGLGEIVGDYTAYLRFVDRLGYFSNLSPVSAEYTAQNGTGTITDASNETPIVVTSAAHGLTTGTRVKIEGVGGNDAANDSFLITVLTSDTFSLDNSSGTGAYSGGGTWISGVSTITYTNVATTSDPKVVSRQILRNTDGQAQTYYVDIDTTDLSSSTFSSTNTDAILQVQESQALLGTDNEDLANVWTVPPNFKEILAHHRDRMFYLKDGEARDGCVQVTAGSTSVQGVGAFWTEAMSTERLLFVKGATRSYSISAINATTQVATLSEAYADDTDKFALYTIRPSDGERRVVYFSEPGVPDAVPRENQVPVPEDDDDLTGGMSKSSFLYFLKRRHIYRLTFQTDPALDGDAGVYLAKDRGCVNNRCWIVVGGTGYLLDNEGVHMLGGDETGESLSQAVDEIFDPAGVAELRINWRVSHAFHGVYEQSKSILRWFVALDGASWPRHALCHSLRSGNWWVEAFNRPVTASCAGFLEGVPVVFLGLDHAEVAVLGDGFLDGFDASAGTVRGTVTSATLQSLTDLTASFASVCVNSSVTIAQGRGKGQSRRVVARTATRLTLDRPWSILPNTTSTYQIGGVSWIWRGPWYTFVKLEQANNAGFELAYQPLRLASDFNVRLYANYGDDAVPWGYTRSQNAGVESTSGETDLVCDLTEDAGFLAQNMPRQREGNTKGWRFVQMEMDGVSNAERLRLYELTINGVVGRRQ